MSLFRFSSPRALSQYFINKSFSSHCFRATSATALHYTTSAHRLGTRSPHTKSANSASVILRSLILIMASCVPDTLPHYSNTHTSHLKPTCFDVSVPSYSFYLSKLHLHKNNRMKSAPGGPTYRVDGHVTGTCHRRVQYIVTNPTCESFNHLFPATTTLPPSPTTSLPSVGHHINTLGNM